jgi:hypothetical protein
VARNAKMLAKVARKVDRRDDETQADEPLTDKVDSRSLAGFSEVRGAFFRRGAVRENEPASLWELAGKDIPGVTCVSAFVSAFPPSR